MNSRSEPKRLKIIRGHVHFRPTATGWDIYQTGAIITEIPPDWSKKWRRVGSLDAAATQLRIAKGVDKATIDAATIEAVMCEIIAGHGGETQ